MRAGNNLFNESQSHFDAPTDVGVQLVDALRSESHPPVPPFGDALVPSAGRRPSSERSSGIYAASPVCSKKRMAKKRWRAGWQWTLDLANTSRANHRTPR